MVGVSPVTEIMDLDKEEIVATLGIEGDFLLLLCLWRS